MKWYVVVDDYCTNPHPEDAVWTISRNSSEPGWETDSGFCGYGLVRVDAEELANAANEIERLRAEVERLRETLARMKRFVTPMARGYIDAALEGPQNHMSKPLEVTSDTP